MLFKTSLWNLVREVKKSPPLQSLLTIYAPSAFESKCLSDILIQETLSLSSSKNIFLGTELNSHWMNEQLHQNLTLFQQSEIFIVLNAESIQAPMQKYFLDSHLTKTAEKKFILLFNNRPNWYQKLIGQNLYHHYEITPLRSLEIPQAIVFFEEKLQINLPAKLRELLSQNLQQTSLEIYQALELYSLNTDERIIYDAIKDWSSRVDLFQRLESLPKDNLKLLKRTFAQMLQTHSPEELIGIIIYREQQLTKQLEKSCTTNKERSLSLLNFFSMMETAIKEKDPFLVEKINFFEFYSLES